MSVIYKGGQVYRLLLIIYGVFLVSLLFKSHDTILNQYVSSMIDCLLICSILALSVAKDNKFGIGTVFLVLLLGFYIILVPIIQTYIYVLVLYVLIVGYASLFLKYKLTMIDFIQFINLTYFVYFFLSFIVWVGLVPNIFYDMSFFQVPEFYVDFGFISYYIMPGFDGSPAGLDVLSVIAVLVNFFYSSSKFKCLFIVLGLAGIILTFRLTPLVSLGVVVILYPFYNHKALSTFLVLFTMSLFILMLYILLNYHSFEFNNQTIHVWDFGYVVTHARSMIWEQQLKILLNEYDFFDYIFGRFSIQLFEVPHYQLWGQLRDDGLYGNPHNTYLLLFFRSPLLFIIFFVLFVIFNYINFERKKFTIIFFIFLVGFTNSSIIGLGNPIFIIVLTYLLTQKKVICEN